MALRITIQIFSGRPNPVVLVSGPEEKELLERLAAPRNGGADRGGRPSYMPESILGYRGLIIEQVDERPPSKRRGAKARPVGGLPPRVRVVDGTLYGLRAPRPTRDRFIEDFVCGSTGPVRLAGMGPEFPDFCRKEIARFRELIARYKLGKIKWPVKKVCTCAPLWEPAWWNDAGQVQWNNNCYNYGTDYRTDTYAQPGNANNAQYSSFTCAQVKAGAIADALIDSPNAKNKCPKEGHLVALVVNPNSDFHWYRKGRNGYWTHKPGGTPATDRDNSGNLISDPRTADRGGYTDFCTFMVVMHGHVKIR